MSFPKYPEYKDSGVEWLGEVPAHWKLPRLKHLARIRNGRDYKEVEVESGGYPVIGSGGEFTRASSYLYKGESVLLGRKGTIDRPLYINGAFWTVDTMFYTELSSRVNGRFLFYYATCFRFDQYSTNTALPSMAQEDLANIQLAVPEPQEQVAIASFLDHETARIDALVEEQQRLIKLLKEKRQAVISHAVTKGLDPDVPMKDSGVEWLGEVPEHWEVVKLGYLAISRGGGTPPKDELQYWNGDIPWVTPKDMKQQWITSTIDTLSDAALHASPVSMIETGHVLIVFRSGILRHRIPAAINKVPVTVNQDLRAYNVMPRMLPAFFLRLTQGLNRELLPEWSKQGATVESLDSELVSSTQLPVPPLTEQEAITSFLDRETARIDALIEDGEKVISFLKERRSALISAAVTGKIDVRGWQPPEGSMAFSEATQTEAV